MIRSNKKKDLLVKDQPFKCFNDNLTQSLGHYCEKNRKHLEIVTANLEKNQNSINIIKLLL
jgi:hypothetical protein